MSDEPLSPERIAREAAEALVTVAAPYPGRTFVVTVAGCYDGYQKLQAEAEAEAAETRAQVALVVLAAIDRALRVPPVPGGLGEGRLAEIDGTIAAVGDAYRVDASILLPKQVEAVYEALEDLRGELLRVYAILRVYGDGEQVAYLAGFDAGRRAGEARVARLERALRRIDAEWVPGHASPLAVIAREALEADSRRRD